MQESAYTRRRDRPHSISQCLSNVFDLAKDNPLARFRPGLGDVINRTGHAKEAARVLFGRRSQEFEADCAFAGLLALARTLFHLDETGFALMSAYLQPVRRLTGAETG